jgi:hypothetical protein
VHAAAVTAGYHAASLGGAIFVAVGLAATFVTSRDAVSYSARAD